MLDATMRRHLAGPLDRVARVLDRPGVTPDRLTLAGLVLGLASAVLAADRLWLPALACWLASRLLDGLDGPLARRRAAGPASGPASDGARGGEPGEAGGFLDICADFVSYGAGVVGVAVGVSGGFSGGLMAAEPGEWLPFAAVLLGYYLNGSAFLAFSSIAERTGHTIDDGRSLSFLGGLAEGTETVVVHALWLLLPGIAPAVAWVWAVVCGVSATQRVVGGHRALSRPPAPR